MATIDLTLSDDDAPPAAPPVVHDLTLDSDSDVEQAPANAGEAPQPARQGSWLRRLRRFCAEPDGRMTLGSAHE